MEFFHRLRCLRCAGSYITSTNSNIAKRETQSKDIKINQNLHDVPQNEKEVQIPHKTNSKNSSAKYNNDTGDAKQNIRRPHNLVLQNDSQKIKKALKNNGNSLKPNTKLVCNRVEFQRATGLYRNVSISDTTKTSRSNLIKNYRHLRYRTLSLNSFKRRLIRKKKVSKRFDQTSQSSLPIKRQPAKIDITRNNQNTRLNKTVTLFMTSKVNSHGSSFNKLIASKLRRSQDSCNVDTNGNFFRKVASKLPWKTSVCPICFVVNNCIRQENSHCSSNIYRILTFPHRCKRKLCSKHSQRLCQRSSEDEDDYMFVNTGKDCAPSDEEKEPSEGENEDVCIPFDCLLNCLKMLDKCKMSDDEARYCVDNSTLKDCSPCLKAPCSNHLMRSSGRSLKKSENNVCKSASPAIKNSRTGEQNINSKHSLRLNQKYVEDTNVGACYCTINKTNTVSNPCIDANTWTSNPLSCTDKAVNTSSKQLNKYTCMIKKSTHSNKMPICPEIKSSGKCCTNVKIPETPPRCGCLFEKATNTSSVQCDTCCPKPKLSVGCCTNLKLKESLPSCHCVKRKIKIPRKQCPCEPETTTACKSVKAMKIVRKICSKSKRKQNSLWSFFTSHHDSHKQAIRKILFAIIAITWCPCIILIYIGWCFSRPFKPNHLMKSKNRQTNLHCQDDQDDCRLQSLWTNFAQDMRHISKSIITTDRRCTVHKNTRLFSTLMSSRHDTHPGRHRNYATYYASVKGRTIKPGRNSKRKPNQLPQSFRTYDFNSIFSRSLHRSPEKMSRVCNPESNRKPLSGKYKLWKPLSDQCISRPDKKQEAQNIVMSLLGKDKQPLHRCKECLAKIALEHRELRCKKCCREIPRKSSVPQSITYAQRNRPRIRYTKSIHGNEPKDTRSRSRSEPKWLSTSAMIPPQSAVSKCTICNIEKKTSCKNIACSSTILRESLNSELPVKKKDQMFTRSIESHLCRYYDEPSRHASNETKNSSLHRKSILCAFATCDLCGLSNKDDTKKVKLLQKKSIPCGCSKSDIFGCPNEILRLDQSDTKNAKPSQMKSVLCGYSKSDFCGCSEEISKRDQDDAKNIPLSKKMSVLCGSSQSELCPCTDEISKRQQSRITNVSLLQKNSTIIPRQGKGNITKQVQYGTECAKSLNVKSDVCECTKSDVCECYSNNSMCNKAIMLKSPHCKTNTIINKINIPVFWQRFTKVSRHEKAIKINKSKSNPVTKLSFCKLLSKIPQRRPLSGGDCNAPIKHSSKMKMRKIIVCPLSACNPKQNRSSARFWKTPHPFDVEPFRMHQPSFGTYNPCSSCLKPPQINISKCNILPIKVKQPLCSIKPCKTHDIYKPILCKDLAKTKCKFLPTGTVKFRDSCQKIKCKCITHHQNKKVGGRQCTRNKRIQPNFYRKPPEKLEPCPCRGPLPIRCRLNPRPSRPKPTPCYPNPNPCSPNMNPGRPCRRPQPPCSPNMNPGRPCRRPQPPDCPKQGTAKTRGSQSCMRRLRTCPPNLQTKQCSLPKRCRLWIQNKFCRAINEIKAADREAWKVEGTTCENIFMNTLKYKPGFWFFRYFPNCYPSFLSLYKSCFGCGRFCILFCSFCMWSPFLVCCYICLSFCRMCCN